MDVKPESAAKTLVRIEVLAMQGLVRAVLLFLFGACTIPAVPVILAITRWRQMQAAWWKKAVRIPAWGLVGMLLGVAAPFVAFWRGIADTGHMAVREWKGRWRNGIAKYLDGRPMVIPTLEQQQRLEAAITRGVIADYNAEARRHGQGIPPVD